MLVLLSPLAPRLGGSTPGLLHPGGGSTRVRLSTASSTCSLMGLASVFMRMLPTVELLLAGWAGPAASPTHPHPQPARRQSRIWPICLLCLCAIHIDGTISLLQSSRSAFLSPCRITARHLTWRRLRLHTPYPAAPSLAHFLHANLPRLGPAPCHAVIPSASTP